MHHKLAECRFALTALGALAWSAVLSFPCCYAQLNYVSDSCSVTASGSLYTNEIAAGFTSPYENVFSLTYSGGHSLSARPPQAFANFNNSVGDSDKASLAVQENYASGTVTNYFNYSGRSVASQNSFLTPTEIYCQGDIQAFLSYSDNRGGLGSEQSSSLFQESFSVTSPEKYQFTITIPGGNFSDWGFGAWYQCTLTSSSLGTIFSVPPEYWGTWAYNGLLLPNDTYTLSLNAYGGTANNMDFGAGTLTADFTIPEPSSAALAGLALLLFLVRRESTIRRGDGNGTLLCSECGDGG